MAKLTEDKDQIIADLTAKVAKQKNDLELLKFIEKERDEQAEAHGKAMEQFKKETEARLQAESESLIKTIEKERDNLVAEISEKLKLKSVEVTDLTSKLQEARDTLMLRDQEILNLKKEVEELIGSTEEERG